MYVLTQANEKYIGDALLQKTYAMDILTKKRVKNNGIVLQYYVENSHEAIIPRDLYMQVQEEMTRRQTSKVARTVKSRSTAVSIPCPVLFIADTAAIFTDGHIGVTWDTGLLFGDA